jgi:nitroimidazol reductase NimA-like FMN-containing flavoprotein (pyridoxamine 5'-phosphate oxidase superfamily)
MSRPTQLDEDTSRDLLVSGELGRVAMATPVGPRIVPVNYAVHGSAIVFRTTPYSELSTYGWNTDLAFEVDHLDPDSRSGWSVVALGRAQIIEDPLEIREVRSTWDPDPWASGVRNLYVKLVWRELRGVCLGGLLTTSAP